MKKLDYIDALRGLAILGVIAVHTSQYGSHKLPYYILDFVNQGARGVQLFFLASAFTLFLSFKNRIHTEKNAVRNFFIRRFFRIAPMYYLGIFYYLWQNNFGVIFKLGDEKHSSASLVVANLTFTHGVNPYYINSLVPGGWSITVEFMFYALVPLLFLWIKNISHSFNFLIFTLVLNALLRFYFLKYPLIGDLQLWQDFLFFYIFSQLPVFTLGLFFYFLVIENQNLKDISPKSLFVFCFLICFSICKPIFKIFDDHIIFSIGFLFLAYALSRSDFKVLNNAVVRYIGEISFSMYLVHFAVLYWLTYFGTADYFGKGLTDYVIRFMITLGISSIFSILFYRCIEVPFQDIGKKLIKKLS